MLTFIPPTTFCAFAGSATFCKVEHHVHITGFKNLYIPSSAANMAQTTQMLALRRHIPLPVANINSVWMLVCVALCLSGAASQPWSEQSSVTRAEALATTTFMATTNVTPSQVTTTGIPEAHLSHDEIEPTVITGIDTVNVAAIDTDRPDAGRYSKARTADPLSHRAETTGDDADSRIRTIFFETVAACIGLATLITAVLALRRMPKQKQPDPESPPLGRNSHLPSQHAELELTQNWGEPVEFDVVQTAVEMQCGEPAIRTLNAQAIVHPSGSTAMTGRGATLDDQTDLQPLSK